jgi:hypothetical protein
MSRKLMFLAVLVMLAVPAFAQEGWRVGSAGKGAASPDTESRKTVDGLGGLLIVTPDADWQAKWQTPSETIPHFTEVQSLARGKKAFVLTFVANPLPDSHGEANVTCDVDVLRPDGSTNIHQADAPCLKGKLALTPDHVFLSAAVIAFTGDPGDPSGKWVVRITLKDHVRGVVVPLQTSFVLQ